jgi:hypothetical protein
MCFAQPDVTLRVVVLLVVRNINVKCTISFTINVYLTMRMVTVHDGGERQHAY